SLLNGAEMLEAASPTQVRAQGGDEGNPKAFPKSGDGRRLVPAQHKAFRDPLQDRIGRIRARQPCLKSGVAQSVRTFGDEDDLASLAHCPGGILERLVGLVEIDVPRKTPGTHDGYVR